MTDPARDGDPPQQRPSLPPDPAAYDHPRSEIARQKGLDQPYIAGGTDPTPDAGQREERRLLRVLLIMVVVIVLAGFVLGALGVIVQQLL